MAVTLCVMIEALDDISIELNFTESPREKPTLLTVHDDLTGLYILKQGRKSNPNKLNPGKSVDDQMDDLDRWQPKGMFELGRVIEDRQGASRYSAKTERAKWAECLRIIRTHPVAVLSVWELSRAARRLKVFGEMMETLQDRGVLIQVGGRLYNPNDPDDAVQLGINAVMDEAFVARQRRSTKRGLRSSAAAGRPHGSHVYGYRRIYDQHTKALLGVEIDPVQSKIVTEIFERVIEGESAHDICRDLDRRGIPRPRQGRNWWPTIIRKMIECPQYVGIRSHTDRETKATVLHQAMWGAIIPIDMQRNALAALDKQSVSTPWSREAKYLLTGYLECGRCLNGQAMNGNRQGGLKRRAMPSDWPMVYDCRKCRMSRNMEGVDRTVIDTVNMWLSDNNVVVELASAGDSSGDLARLRRELAVVVKELEDGYSAGLSVRGLQSLEQRLLPRQEELDKAIAKIEIESRGGGWGDVLAERLPARVPNDVNEARRYLARLVHVTLLPAGRGSRFHPDQVQIVAR